MSKGTFSDIAADMVPSQFVFKSTRTQVNSFSFWSIRTHRFGQFVLIWSTRTHCLVSSYSFWSIRPHIGQLLLMFFGQFVLILGRLFENANKRNQYKIYLTPLKRKIKSI